MAKEFYDWVKLALDNKWLVMLCFTGFTSMVTNASQFMTNSDHEAEQIASQEQIATIATYYAEKAETKTIVKKMYRPDCGNCVKLMALHIKELH